MLLDFRSAFGAFEGQLRDYDGFSCVILVLGSMHKTER